MLRTIIIVFLLFVAVYTVPLWAQIIVFLVAVICIPYRLALFVPAVFADVVYAPSSQFSIETLKTTLLIAVILIIHWLVMTQTRLSHIYGLEAK